MGMRFYQSLIGNALAEAWESDVALHAQRVRLAALIRHAVENVPFYREHFRRAGIRTEHIRTPRDLLRIPVISKIDVIRAGDSFLDRHAPRGNLAHGSSSGSSGLRLPFHARWEELSALGGILWSALLASGVRPVDRIVSVSSRHFQWAPPPYYITPLRSEARIDEWVQSLRRIEPTVIIGPTEAIAGLSFELQRERGPRLGRIRGIYTYGWTLTEEIREIIRDALHCDPIDLYASTETIWCGAQCGAREGFHIPYHRLIVQVAHPTAINQEAVEGQVGELVITDLTRRTMPFIRYRTGDAAAVVHERCACGRGGPQIRNLLGRIMDVLVSTEGRPVRPGAFGLVKMHRLGYLADYQLIQESRNQVRFMWVRGTQWSPSAMDEILNGIRSALGPVDIVQEPVEEIRFEGEGKRRRIRRAFEISNEEILRLRSPGS